MYRNIHTKELPIQYFNETILYSNVWHVFFPLYNVVGITHGFTQICLTRDLYQQAGARLMFCESLITAILLSPLPRRHLDKTYSSWVKFLTKSIKQNNHRRQTFLINWMVPLRSFFLITEDFGKVIGTNECSKLAQSHMCTQQQTKYSFVSRKPISIARSTIPTGCQFAASNTNCLNLQLWVTARLCPTKHSLIAIEVIQQSAATKTVFDGATATRIQINFVTGAAKLCSFALSTLLN